MVAFSLLVVALFALAPVQAHYYINKANGGTGALRPIALRMGGENTPVSGSQIETDDMICGVARPFSSRAAQPLKVDAGSVIKVTYDIPVSHRGPCFAYIGEGLKPAGWSKILEIYMSPQTCDEVINANGNTLDVKIPAELAPGSYVLSVHHIGLHSAGSPGGAQFYVRCIDFDVVNGGSKKPTYEIKIPGAWNINTPGVVYNLYYPNGPPYANYPKWGGNLWVPSNSGPVSPVVSPRTSPVTSPRSSPSPTGPCAKLNQQCGGSSFKGVTCCETGTTCTFMNSYYSQCK